MHPHTVISRDLLERHNELLERQLAEAWDEVERLRGQVERLLVEKHNLVERLMKASSDPT
jgi:ElaB/YqjD/DUF883 family membrane-anchored ribosome-binding protein